MTKIFFYYVELRFKVYASFYKAFDFDKMNRISQEFELPDNQRLDKMSYGQRKKFVIAFALSTNCKLILLDEPTNGLDIPSKSVFRKVMVSSVEDDQLVIIPVVHLNNANF